MNRKKNNKLELSSAEPLGHNPFASLGAQFGVKASKVPAKELGKTKQPEQAMLLVRMEKRKKGKVVTCIYHIAKDHKDLLKQLKQKMGTGGTVDQGTLELQGDHRSSLPEVLEKMGFKVRLGN